jgi:hypothetical protein
MRTQGANVTCLRSCGWRVAGVRSAGAGTGRAITANELKTITNARSDERRRQRHEREETDRDAAGTGHVRCFAQQIVAVACRRRDPCATRPRATPIEYGGQPRRRPPSRFGGTPCAHAMPTRVCVGILTCWLPSDECAVRKESVSVLELALQTLG